MRWNKSTLTRFRRGSINDTHPCIGPVSCNLYIAWTVLVRDIKHILFSFHDTDAFCTQLGDSEYLFSLQVVSK